MHGSLCLNMGKDNELENLSVEDIAIRGVQSLAKRIGVTGKYSRVLNATPEQYGDVSRGKIETAYRHLLVIAKTIGKDI